MEVKAEGPSSTSSPRPPKKIGRAIFIRVRVLRTGAVEEGDGV